MSDNGPDAHEETINCQHCDGRGTLYHAYYGVVRGLEQSRKAHMEVCGKLWAEKNVSRAPRTDVAGAVPDWRELSRRLYVELFHCDQQMRSTRDENGEPHWTQSSVVRDVLADAKAALDDAPQPPSADAAAAPAAAQAVEAVAVVDSWVNGSYSRKYQVQWLRDVEAGTKLYAAPPAPASAPVGLTDQQVHDAIKHAEQEICRIAPFSSIEDRRFAFCRALLEGAKP